MSNIIIKKLESKIFDSSNEALDRLNDLGRNDIDSEAYKDLADQVRSTCPCNCYFSTRKRYKVEVKYTGHTKTLYSYPDEYPYPMHGIIEYLVHGSGNANIEKGNSSCTIPIVSYYETYKDMSRYPVDQEIPDFACSSTITKNVNFSISLSDDCKHWIFSYSPSWVGQISYDVMNPDSEPQGCFEQSISLSYNNDMLQEETYPEVTTAYPSGSMKLVYHSESHDDNYGDPIDYSTDITIEATVTPLEDNINTYNSINELYNELSSSLK